MSFVILTACLYLSKSIKCVYSLARSPSVSLIRMRKILLSFSKVVALYLSTRIIFFSGVLHILEVDLLSEEVLNNLLKSLFSRQAH